MPPRATVATSLTLIQKVLTGMRYGIVILRVFACLSLTLWAGGFTFYSAVVIHALHEAIGSVETGYITQNVTDTLNVIGLASLLLLWSWTILEMRSPTGVRPWVRIVLLLVSSTILAFLIVLHRKMDQHLDQSGLRGFYPLHRQYLIASTAQWLANGGLLILLCAGRWTSPNAGSSHERES